MGKLFELDVISPASNPLSIDSIDARCRQTSCWFDVKAYHPGVAEEIGVPLPDKLHRAVDKRKAEYLSGRLCARQALQQLGFTAAHTFHIGTGDNRQPLWPEGVVGSITHSHGFASAIVAPADAVKSIGIDSEFEINNKTAGNVTSHILVDGEAHAANRELTNSAEQYLTLIFSAKESIFKCLYPLVNIFFDFHAARVELDPARPGRFQFTLLKPLSTDFPAAFQGHGQYTIDGHYVHTAVVLHHL